MDDALIQMLLEFAEKLNTTPIEVMRTFLLAGIWGAFAFGMFVSFIGDMLLDRLFSGIGRFFRWLRSRKSAK